MAWSIADHIDEALSLVKAGKCKHIVDLCCHFEVSRTTWYAALKNVELNTIKDKLDRLDDEIHKLWVNMGLSGKVDKTAWVFCMKNIFGWRDRQDIDVNAKGSVNLVIDKQDADL